MGGILPMLLRAEIVTAKAKRVDLAICFLFKARRKVIFVFFVAARANMERAWSMAGLAGFLKSYFLGVLKTLGVRRFGKGFSLRMTTNAGRGPNPFRLFPKTWGQPLTYDKYENEGGVRSQVAIPLLIYYRTICFGLHDVLDFLLHIVHSLP